MHVCKLPMLTNRPQPYNKVYIKGSLEQNAKKYFVLYVATIQKHCVAIKEL